MQIDRTIAKGQLVPLLFSQQNVADAQAAVAMNIIEATGATDSNIVLSVTEYVMPWAFDVVGVSLVSNEARTAGTCTVDVTVNGTVTGLQAALDATNTTRDTGTQLRESDRGVAGDRIGVKLTTASWTPVTADAVVVVWAIVALEGI